jgi:hypothetical protein
MNRRKILGLFSTAPFAAKQAVEAQAAALAHVEISGIHDHNPGGMGVEATSDGYTHEQVKRALLKPFIGDQIRERIKAEHAHVYAIDYDLASKRSFSLAAKICYQRQRNIERELERMQRESNWYWLRDFIKKHG